MFNRLDYQPLFGKGARDQTRDSIRSSRLYSFYKRSRRGRKLLELFCLKEGVLILFVWFENDFLLGGGGEQGGTIVYFA